MIKKQRRNSKKLYRGGSGTPLPTPELAKVDEKNEISQELAKVHESNEIHLPSISSIPLPGIQILGKAEQFVEGAASNVIDKGANLIGVNLNNPQSLGDKLKAIMNQFTNPEVASSLKGIASNVGNLASIGITAAAPVAEAVSDKLLPVVTKDIEKGINAAAATGVNLVEDVAGPIIGIPRTILSAAEAGEAAINAGSEIVRDVSEGTEVAAQQFTDLVKNPGEAVATTIQQQSNTVGSKLINNPAAVQAAGAGKRLNCLRKDAIKIGGYIEEAREKLKSSHLTKRKNNVKHRKTTRRNSTYSFSSN